jgi:opacity protein-like surface antigen
MKHRILFVVGLFLLSTSTASAQYTAPASSQGSAPAHKAELVLLGGYAWTLSEDVYDYTTSGELDINDAAYWGIAIDINMARQTTKTGQLRLMYRREDSEVVFRPNDSSTTPPTPVDCAIEYWQIGGLGGIKRGNAMPFTSVTLGGTRFSAQGEDEWKFSMIFGLGVKVYSSPKFGFMIQGNWPITFTDTWGGASVGTGGAGVAIGGTGLSQLDLGGGLIVTF